MPDIKTDDGCTIHAEIEGPDNAPVLMLSNSLGTTLHMWDDQVAPFTQHFRLLRYDRRGHGQSSVPKGPYTMERLGRDVLAVLDGLGIAKINWCGLSMGGMVGQWLGANAPEPRRTSSSSPIRRVISRTRPAGTTGSSSSARKASPHSRRRIWSAGSPRDFASAVRRSWRSVQKMFAATALDGYLGCGAAVRDMDHRALLPKIAAPTLVIAGKHDPATPLEGNEYIQKNIPGAKLAVLEAAHLANVEQPQAYADTVLGFLLN